MKIVNKIIENLRGNELDGLEALEISNCIIKTLNFNFFNPDYNIIIENCIIENFLIHSTWFTGLTFKDNIVKNHIDYQMGGHNEKAIILTGNVFKGFVNFFDCQFDETLIIKNNIFLTGTNILGNKDEGFSNTFNKDFQIHENIGSVNLNSLE